MIKKDLKINIKNSQLAAALELGKLKEKLAQKKAETPGEKEDGKHVKEKHAVHHEADAALVEGAEAPKRKARTHSVFAEHKTESEEEIKAHEKLEVEQSVTAPIEEELPPVVEVQEEVIAAQETVKTPIPPQVVEPVKPKPPAFFKREQLGPTGRHIKDLLPKKPVEAKAPTISKKVEEPKPKVREEKAKEEIETSKAKFDKSAKTKEFKDLKPARKPSGLKTDGKGRMGGSEEDDLRYRKRKGSKPARHSIEETVIRPTKLSVRLPISIKDLASEMKLKASELIQKLFLQGVIVMINDVLDDETTIQLLGHEFGCEISIDTSEEERIRITDKTIREEIGLSKESDLILRAPIVAFMGHVDHGKTSLIDYIRKSDIAADEAGAITQHIGAFRCKTQVGDITILDTPGHEAFSAMRARGAVVTDIVVLVVAGDEGIRAQTLEALRHAKDAGVTIVVAANKCDKPNFDFDRVLRQLADNDLLPESWGGQTIVVKCSALTGEGIPELLDMLALQAEVLELKANPGTRARGTVIESQLHKGLGMVTTILVLNGTLKPGDALVFEETWGRVKTMFDEHGKKMISAGPSTPVEITGLSGLPEAGEEFIVVPSEQEARKIAEARYQGKRQHALQQKKAVTLDSLLQQSKGKDKKTLKIVLRADVQGSLEALKTAIEKIQSDKADAEVIFAGVGEISESDVQLAAASNAMILGFHVQVESHAEPLVKQFGVAVKIHNIIYHAIDDVKSMMTNLLDKISKEVEKGKAEVKQTFKSSQVGIIAGCQVSEGSINRNNLVRIVRNGEVIWKGTITSLRRVKEDVREVQKGIECGITLSGTNNVEPGDIIEAYEITYISQSL